MPIYEYQCTKCGKIHEIWQKISEPPVKECPDCTGPLHKLISLTSFQLKGGGWYVDGYSTDQPNKKNGGADDASKSIPADGAKKDKDEKSSKPEQKTASAEQSNK